MFSSYFDQAACSLAPEPKGRRYIVALRNLEDADGKVIEAPAALRTAHKSLKMLKRYTHLRAGEIVQRLG